MEQLLPFIQAVGVPAGIAFYVLWQTTQAVKDLRDEVHQLNQHLLEVIRTRGSLAA
jgi:hypothetical protein